MKRNKIIAGVLSILALLGLSSCHGTLVPSGPNISPTSTTYISPTSTTYKKISFDETKKYKIEFWAKNDSNVEQKHVYLNTVKSFNEYYPNIEVTIRDYSSYEDIYTDVVNNVSTNTTPNVCIAYPDHVATYLTGNLVLPLDKYVSDSSYGLGGSKVKFESVSKDEIVSQFYNEGIINNATYLLPFMRSTEALYINKTYVESLGFTIPDIVTWDWVWEVCQKGRDERPNDNQFYPFIYKSTDNMFIQLCKQYNYPFTNDEGENLFFTDDVAKMLLNIGNKYDKKIFNTFSKVSYPGNHMNIGNCIMAVDSTAGSTWIGANCPNNDSSSTSTYNYETVVRPIPQVDVNNPIMISQGPSICIFDKKDDDVNVAAWLFTQFLLNKDTQLSYCKTEGYSPVTTQVINSDEYKNYLNDSTEYVVKRAATKLVSDNSENTFVTSVFNGSIDSRNVAGYLIEGMSGTRYRTLEKVYDLYSRAKKTYKIN